jgi:hypothetical protein
MATWRHRFAAVQRRKRQEGWMFPREVRWASDGLASVKKRRWDKNEEEQ